MPAPPRLYSLQGTLKHLRPSFGAAWVPLSHSRSTLPTRKTRGGGGARGGLRRGEGAAEEGAGGVGEVVARHDVGGTRRRRTGQRGAHEDEEREAESHPDIVARRCRTILAMADDGDAIEILYARGVTDGLPVIPPTAARVRAAVEASGRAGDELIGLVAPRLGRPTVQKIAINAVLAGGRPEYVPAGDARGGGGLGPPLPPRRAAGPDGRP